MARIATAVGVALAALVWSGGAQAEEPLDCVGQPNQSAIGFATICAGEESFEASQLSGWTCDQLWNLRNNILYTEGYCFETPRGKAAFDDVGCSARTLAQVPLNAHQRHNVDLIASLEQQQSCPAD
ncbi:MAG: YARHG domain-containing protein [Pseudomonadota bacterium]